MIVAIVAHFFVIPILYTMIYVPAFIRRTGSVSDRSLTFTSRSYLHIYLYTDYRYTR